MDRRASTSNGRRRGDTLVAHAYVAVHGGAGVHRESTEKEVKQAMKDACIKAIELSAKTDASALDMVESAICVLEDEPHLNAGVGSNLTLDGTVECDAAMMSGPCHAFGSVGAIPGTKNPIKVARSILEYSAKEDKLGRIPPLTLVSTGAASFAKSNGIEPVSPSSLITPESQSQWKKWKDRLRSPNAIDTTSSPSSPPTTSFKEKLTIDEVRSPNEMQRRLDESLRDRQDTVGAVAWHPRERKVVAGVSSGGMLLKLPGRVGEAGVYGAGCWAQQGESLEGNHEIGVACSVSGTGEHIMRAQLARTIGERVFTALQARSAHEDEPTKDEADNEDEDDDFDEDIEHDPLDPHTILEQTLGKEFWETFRKEGELSPSAGVLLMTREVDRNGECLGECIDANEAERY
ncbi:asparaginase [Coprinopsis cinerea okayama7|uniref:Asparaginase n=1 Tax=Coprinopsis cinerea (strain Okayama-7 / 130 / ATCC MYA-4618 / FGSC 9003) TaxID=240176 RepID=A8N5A2_COPC7|nr:asparaginase [Coprinopsis cinerea okayama7\|eukprot:XP_001830047.2 asparaginase [Coprinopsis cinerea okayama7\